MSTKKKVIAVVITTVALTVGSVGFSQAASKPMGGGHAAHHAAKDAEHEARQALVSKTIGVDSATVRARLAAGESLGAIAGAKKADLIAVLVADRTKRIDAEVTAGKLTAAQAATRKAALTAHVTAEVDSVGGKGHKDGKGDKGGRGHGGPGKGGTGAAPTTSPASAA